VYVLPFNFQGGTDRKGDLMFERFVNNILNTQTKCGIVNQDNIGMLVDDSRVIARINGCGGAPLCLGKFFRDLQVRYLLTTQVISRDTFVLTMTLYDLESGEEVETKVLSSASMATFVTGMPAAKFSVEFLDEYCGPSGKAGEKPAAPKKPAAAAPAPAAAKSGTESEEGAAAADDQSVPVLDLCEEQAPGGAAGRFPRIGMVLFAPANAALVEEGELEYAGRTAGERKVLREIKAGEIVQRAFTASFPMKRFDTVVSAAPPRDAWFEVDGIPVVEIAEYLKSKSGRGAAFAAYSAGCASYMVMPIITDYRAEWRKTDRKVSAFGKPKRVNDWVLDFAADFWVSIFRRVGDKYVRHAEIAVKASAAESLKSEKAAADEQAAAQPPRAAQGAGCISPVPHINCPIPPKGIPGRPAFGGCRGAIKTIPGADGTAGESWEARQCQGAATEEEMKGAAACAVWKSTEYASRFLQKEARRVKGLGLYGPLVNAAGNPGVALGKKDGVGKGLWFRASSRRKDGSYAIDGYAKVVRAGKGGDGGQADPSELMVRIGEIRPGSKLEERRRIGVSLGFKPSATIMFGSANSRLSPAAAAGLGLDLGIDLTPWTFNEFWLHAVFSQQFGLFTNAFSSILNICVVPQFVFYTGRYLNVLAGLGPTLTVSYLSMQDSGKAGAGFTGGLAAEAGLDVVLAPEWYLRLEALWRQNFADVKYGGDLGDRKRDNLSGLELSLGVNYVF
jgi:hypothetical protein